MVNPRNFPANEELLFVWGRYLYWAELKRRDWDKFMAEKGAEANNALPEWLGVSCYWASSLYVVIEGWETAKFKHPVVDALLGVSNYRDVLRKLRNGTFHYQPALISPKITEFFQSMDVTAWSHFLHQEFCRWLRDYVEAVEQLSPLSPEQMQEWQKNFADLVGWLPLRPAEEKLKALRKEFDEIEQELDASGSSSKEAQDLRGIIAGYDSVVQKTADVVREPTGSACEAWIEPRQLHPLKDVKLVPAA